jgi:two-component system OmpR family sensor kinase
MRLSFKARLSLGHMVAVALILAVVAAGAEWLLSRFVLRFVDGELLDLSHIEAAGLPPQPNQPVRIHEPPATAPPSFIRLDKFVQIIRLDGQVLAKSANLGPAQLPAPAPVLARLRRSEAVFETLETFGEEPIRLLSLPVDAGGTSYVIQVAISLNDVNSALRATRWLVAAMSLAILIAVGATGALLARRALQPIDRIVQRAHTIGESNLRERLPHPGSQDEIGRLVETLNEMLARIEQSVETQRRFTGDASHELLSPLSRLRAELEVTLRRPRDLPEYEETLASCLEEVERLSRLTEEMLMLARLDAGESGQALAAPARLGLVLDEAIARLEPDAQRREVTVVLESAADLQGQVAAGAAAVILTNVLDNAVKYSPRGGRVMIRASTEGGKAVVVVSDSGPGLHPDEISQLFARFRRGWAAHVTKQPGTGLGLAVSHALARQQGGRITVESTRGHGATFTVHLPLVA